MLQKEFDPEAERMKRAELYTALRSTIEKKKLAPSTDEIVKNF